MLILTHEARLVSDMVQEHDTKFEESQRLRIGAIAALNEAGQALIRIRDMFAQRLAEGDKTILTDQGTFTSFDNYLLSGAAPVKKTAAYDYIKLAENWKLVLKLGMQDTTDAKTVAKSMRLSRTLKIIDWYKEQLNSGRPEEELTLEQYWLEQETPTGPTKKQLQQELSEARAAIAQANATIESLKAELAKYKQPALPLRERLYAAKVCL